MFPTVLLDVAISPEVLQGAPGCLPVGIAEVVSPAVLLDVALSPAMSLRAPDCLLL